MAERARAAGPAAAVRAPGGRAGRGGVRRRLVRGRRRGRAGARARRASRKRCCSSTIERRGSVARRAARRRRRSRRRPGQALVTGRARLHRQERLSRRDLGLSGGIDSALVLAVAVDALGADKVRAVMMPSPYTADISWIDARDMAQRLGVRYDEISIAPMFEAFRAALAGEFAGLPEDTTEENIQARIRGMLLMALSNKSGTHRADHRQQERDGHRLLHAVRRHGRRLRGDQGRAQDDGLPAGALAQRARPARGRSAVIPERIITRAAVAPSCARTRPTRTACRPTRCSTRSWRATWKNDQGVERDRRGRLRPRRRGARDAPDQDQRVQAPPGAGGHPHHPPRFRQGLALPYHSKFRA